MSVVVCSAYFAASLILSSVKSISLAALGQRTADKRMRSQTRL